MTKEEIEAAITANPEVQNTIVETLKGKGFNVLSKDDHTSFIESERARIASEKTSEIYSGLDRDIIEASGMQKDANEKTYDFAKRAISHFKQLFGTSDATIQELQEKIKTGSNDETLKAQLAAMQKTQQDLSEKLSEKDRAIFEKDVKFDIRSGMAGLKIKAELPESLVKTYVSTIEADLLRSAKTDANGNIYFVDGEGKPILNNSAQVADAAFILADRLKDILDTGRQQQGAGTGGGTGGTGGRGTDTLPEGLKTKIEVAEALKKMGILDGAPEFTKFFNEYLEKHPNLPLR